MQTEARNWKIQLREARAEVPVLVNVTALEIFTVSASPDHSPLEVTATALRNLLAYQVRLIVQHYSADDWTEYPEELSSFLNQVHNWLGTSGNPALFIGRRMLPVAGPEVEKVIAGAKTFPIPPRQCLPRILYAREITNRLLKIKQQNPQVVFRKLYELSCEWYNSLTRPDMQVFAMPKPLEFAEKHVTRHLNRIDYHSARAIIWGKELCESIAKYQAMGFCRKTAASKARRDFIKNHPYPVTDSELLMNEAIPGHSRPAVIRYQKKYLDSLKKQQESQSFPSPIENK